MLLHLLVLAPFVAALLMVMTSKEDSKSSSRMAMLLAGAFTVMSVMLIAGGAQFTDPIAWFQIPGTKATVSYELFANTLSSWMVFLSCALSLVALVSARSTLGNNYRNFAIGIFALMGAMNGTFLARDAVVFFIFFEAMVFPAAILIAGFGGAERRKAAMIFAIYTLVGSAPMMVALWYILTLVPSASLAVVANVIPTLPAATQTALMLSFLLAFLVKTPLFPFHGWQAITYAEAPAPLSAILTGAMSKAGVFGFLVWVVPVFPEAKEGCSCCMWLGLFTAVYGALMALRATDAKKLLAFSSMGHLGLATAAVFCATSATMNEVGTAVLVLLVAHGLSAGAQFILAGVAERMSGTRDINEMGALSSKKPVFSFLFGAAGVAALAVPGTAGFIGEFSVLLNIWKVDHVAALVVGLCIILSAGYMLRFIQKVIFGKSEKSYDAGVGISALEGACIGVMLLLLVAFGMHPAFVTNPSAPQDLVKKELSND